MKKIKVECEAIVNIENVPFGTFVRPISKKGISKKTYILLEYSRSDKKYVLEDYEDFCANYKMLKKGAQVQVGFYF